ncbi:quinone oxidoreductase PIG3-like [Huso huso]|uniref:Quinone oxidoreductase PIG3-like n=1 Tax=Huso huso TaxID=61971 RepID=A0ABR0ZYZ8_HUSHU
MSGEMLAVYTDAPGGPENLYLKKVPRPEPGNREVLIKVCASALNRADLLQRRGRYPPPPGASAILGLEAAGDVSGLGAGCRGSWSVGDRVMALLSGGGNAQYVTVPEDHVMAIPNHMAFSQAAAIPEAWLTAYQLLHLVADVQKGETVLIHAGASGVGTAAIQLCRLAGAVPIVTAGSPGKLKMAAELGAAAGFNYKEEDFSENTLAFTKGHGANAILDCIGGSNWERNVKCLSTDGRWVVYGMMGGSEVHGDILGKLLFKRGRLLTSLLRSRSMEYKANLVKSFRDNVLPHFSPDLPTPLQPVIDCVFPMDQIADAHSYMEANKNTGKIIISIDPST